VAVAEDAVVCVPASRLGRERQKHGQESQLAGARAFSLDDGVDREPHKGCLKFGRGNGSGMRGEFEHPASEGQQFHRGAWRVTASLSSA
jgi:hypothetical protein